MRLSVVLAATVAALVAPACPAASQTFLPPEQAFSLSAKRTDAEHIQLGWTIADGYYLYRERLKVHVQPGAGASTLAVPTPEHKFDTNFNATMDIYHHQLVATMASRAQAVTVEYQGCAEGGLCYPPQFATVQLQSPVGPLAVQPIDGPGDAQTLALEAAVQGAAPEPAAAAAQGPSDLFGQALASGNLLRTAAVFWLAGLLLSFTPCVLPMVPILSSLIAGQGGLMTRRRGLGLSVSYVLGMSLVYAAMGMAAGLAGQGLAAALQNPWVLGSFAGLLALLSLSMFGVYELQMPAAVQERLIGLSDGMRGGAALPVFVMGGLSALVVGPCVAAPLAGALLYISQTHDVLIGGVALFSLALGMGVPLLLVGVSANFLLPRAGAWMELVKHLFGLLLLATAIWIVTPVVAVPVQMLLWAALALGAALILGGIHPISQPKVLRLAGMAALAASAVLFVGAASGGKSVLQPLAHLQPAAGTAQAGPNPAGAGSLAFRTVNSGNLLRELQSVQQAQRTALIDFYADWCVACKEFEAFTFTDPEVRRRLDKANVQLLRVDVTANSSDDKALMSQFALFGPPAVIFARSPGQQGVLHKVIGYEDAREFLASLDRANVPR